MNNQWNDPFKDFREQQERIRNALIGPIDEIRRQQEEFKNLIGDPLRVWREHQQYIAAILDGPIRLIKQQQDLMKKTFGSFSELLKEASEDFQQYKKIMVMLNFPPHHDMDYTNFRDMHRFNQENDEETTKMAIEHLIIENYPDKKISEYLEQWTKIEWLKSRASILKEAIMNYLDGRYFSSISTLLPQIEGVIVERGNLTGFVSQGELKRVASELLSETGKFSLDDAVKLFYLDCVLDSFQHGQIIRSPLSRHAILHGADTHYGYKLNSLRCILFFDYLISKLIVSKH
ncbi:hypothetical protein [Paenibacillus dakarensis]|uniref:hypothetical protein n=1 Tax=Paenibacillus dakarensis TaxID=1527293 RepID=UPI0006D54E4A|nr:hypothetical protein [Paenibacillus dakarensis]